MSRNLLALLAGLLLVASAQAEPMSVTFSRQRAAVGDQAEQTMAVDLRIKTTARRGAEVLDQAETQMQRTQQRLTTTTAVGARGARAAQVEYRKAERQVSGMQPETEPVAGKSYLCERDGEELKISTPEGLLPPLAEYQTVAQNMEMLGRENPLAKHFDGLTVKVGEKVELPKELAAKLLGMEDQLGSAESFTLTLRELKTIEGRTCAVFQTEIKAGSSGSGQMGMLVGGPLVMQVDTCRAVSADFSGPIGMAETHASPGGTVQVTGAGKLRVAIQTRYKDSKTR